MQPRSPNKPPETETLSTIAAQIKSRIRNTLLTSPEFPGFYEQALIAQGYNPNQARNLAKRYRKISGVNMPVSSNVKVCTHIKVTGVRCGSPALRGEQFCYFHQRMHRGVRTPPQARLHPIALIEDEESIQTALMEVINGLMRNTIDLKRAALILRALHIAVKNAARVKIWSYGDQAVREIPNYENGVADATTADLGTAAPGCPDGAAAAAAAEVSADGKAHVATSTEAWENLVPQRSELDFPFPAATPPPYQPTPREKRRATMSQEDLAQQLAIRDSLLRAAKFVETDGPAPAHVGTDAVVRPAKPVASASTPDHTGTSDPPISMTVGNSATAKGPSSTRADQPTNKDAVSAAQAHAVSPRKPPRGIKQTPVPKERKIAAHRATGG